MTAPIFTFDPTISVSSSTVFLSGTAAGDFTKADILVNGSDIGSVQVADGQWTFSAPADSLPSAFGFTLDVTDTSNNTTTVDSNFGVLLGISNHPYTSMQVSNIINNTQTMECFNADGRDMYHMSYVDTGNSSHDLTVTPYFHSDTFTFISIDAAHETINGFNFSGGFHDTISMPSKDFAGIVEVLNNASLSHGNWNITDPVTHSVLTLTGVTPSDVRAARHDFTFNGTGHLL